MTDEEVKTEQTPEGGEIERVQASAAEENAAVNENNENAAENVAKAPAAEKQNIAKEYATKRYRSNLINWGMIPFLLEKEKLPFENLDFIYIPNIKTAIKEKKNKVTAYIVKDTLEPFELSIGEMTDDERDIILAGSLINYYAKTKEVTE